MNFNTRSETAMDAVSVVTPGSFLSGRRMRMQGLGDLLEAGDYGYSVTQDAGGGTDWLATVKDIFTTVTQAELAKDLYELNLQRAKQGLAPIPASAVAPQMNVGIAGDTQKMLLQLGLGAAVILGGAYAFGMIGGARRRRARR